VADLLVLLVASNASFYAHYLGSNFQLNNFTVSPNQSIETGKLTLAGAALLLQEVVAV
jgi:hypothetical protein